MTTSPTIQIAIDADRPYELAGFWAGVTGYEMEDHHDAIEQLIGDGLLTVDETFEVGGRRHFSTASACSDRSGSGPRLLFQKVPEPKAVKDRIHLDLQFGPERREAEVERIIGLGATKLWDGVQGPHVWATLADPEGNEFCVS